LDLIPVLSYLFLRGKCKYCGERISMRYPIVELLTAVGFLLVYLKSGSTIETGAGWIFTIMLITSAFIDADTGIIPNKITYPGIILGLILSYFTVGVPSALLGGSLFGGILLLAALISQGGMGGGDIKLALMVGIFSGLQGAFLAFILSSILGGLWASILLLSGKANIQTAIRFGPFIAIAAWVTWTYGPEITNYYLRLFT
jgi:leader peptidase (prepilin peptidase)/N-methyltransferase